MKRFFYLFASFYMAFFVTIFVQAQNNQEFFLQANVAYEQGNYDTALELYEKISHKGSAIYYNMGNCYYHKDDSVNALVYWERAKQQAKNVQYDFIEQNIKVLVNKYSIEYEFDSWLTVLINKICRSFSLLFWQMLFLLMWIFLWIVIVTVKRKTILIFILIACILCIGNFLHLKKVREKPLAIVKENTSLFIGPSDCFAVMATLKKGQKITIVGVFKEKNDHWYKIMAAKKIGWVFGEKVIEI